MPSQHIHRKPLLLLVVMLGLTITLSAAAQPARPSVATRLGQTVRRVTSYAGDRIVRLRGVERSLQRAERLFERGEQTRALGILRGTLRSKRISDPQRARTLLYTGVVQTQLGNHMQAVRAFSGVLHHQSDFQLPPGVSQEVAGNFDAARNVIMNGAVRGENFSAELPGKLSLGTRVGLAVGRLKDRVNRTILGRPGLLKLHAQTVGRLNVWRALNTLEGQGISRFKVHLEPDAKDWGQARAMDNGDVTIDYSGVHSYKQTLATLAHEAYHLNNPIALTARYSRSIDRYNAAQDRAHQIKWLGRGISKKSPAGRAQRQRLAGDLRKQRSVLHQVGDQLRQYRIKEEGRAEAFAGQVLGRENLPLSLPAWRIKRNEASAWHPAPEAMMNSFLKGANQGIREYTNLQ